MPESPESFAQNPPRIRLERSRTSRAFHPDESLWKKELDQIFELLRKHAAALESSPPDDKKQPILSISVFGTYGSGKTSLLKTLVEEVNGGERVPEKLKDRLYALPVIEPNILAKDEHFLYTFLATALEEDIERQRDREKERERHSSATSRALTPVQQAFQDVSEYLQVIDEVERPAEYDPLGFSLERLERHTSGLLLRKRLGAFIDSLADRLAGNRGRSSLVLLPVDDPDMSLESLTATLDTYRQYLQHPRLVPVFTFTGRLPEELLRVYFARNLLIAERQKLFAELSEPSSSLDMTEHLAVQYMVKLFPIRNRIRLGPAPARVQGGHYVVQDDEKKGEKKVWNLLETASNLLFGYPEWPIAPRVRLALRPSTLRRQIQVLDAMYDSGVSDLQKEASRKDRRWAEFFEKAAWALVNVHRDVLRELRMQMEDLQSLTPRNLSREVLSAILSQDLETRRELLQRWRFQVEDRRGQVLSLLALNAFRPFMRGDEPSGDDPDAVLAESKRKTPPDGCGPFEFSALKGFLWFLDLWTGFYLPQILARNRPNDIAKKNSELGSVHGIGWNLRSGPRHAIREVLSNRDISATGMMLLLPDSFSTVLKKPQGSSKKPAGNKAILALHLWCFFGYKAGYPWAAVSFWRGLGLIGQLLEDRARARTGEESEPDRKQRIRFILSKHCETAREPGAFQEGRQAFFNNWSFPEEPGKDDLGTLTDAVYSWLSRFAKDRVVLESPPPEDSARGNEAKWWAKNSKTSFIRRLHGEYLLGELWPELGGAYFAGPSDDNKPPDAGGALDAWDALARWATVLFRYFEGTQGIKGETEGGRIELFPLQEALFNCPLLAPFFEPVEETYKSLKDPEIRQVWDGNDRKELKKALQSLRQTDFGSSPYGKARQENHPSGSGSSKPT
ncbi:MAG TPA: hypothetical protein VLQ45_14185 [Thermoanaerobaculia bacterium]|nr:hypothetical protein [Thermoanaerobaculia bacterium]